MSEAVGPELDAAVAEEVIGRVVVIAPVGDGLSRTYEAWGDTMEEASNKLREMYADHKGLREPYFCGPEYSTDVAAAFSVWQQFRYVAAGGPQSEGEEDEYWVHIFTDEHFAYAVAPTLPEAICRAALKAVRENNTSDEDRENG